MIAGTRSKSLLRNFGPLEPGQAVPKGRNVTLLDRPVVNITDPTGQVLYQFALGAADIITSDPSAAKECQVQPWMVNQPSVQAGTDEWFKEMSAPLSEMTKLIDPYTIIPVCNKSPEKLKSWLLRSIVVEQARYDNSTAHNYTHENIESPDPYPTNTTVVAKKSSQKKKLFIQVEVEKKKKRSKDWWKVLKLSLPLVPFFILKFKQSLDKMMKGFVFIQFNQYIDCIAKSISTGKTINTAIVGYRSLMAYVKKGKTINEFANMFSVVFCNWNRLLDFITTLGNGAKEKDEKKKWFLYGQAMGKLVVVIASGMNLAK